MKWIRTGIIAAAFAAGLTTTAFAAGLEGTYTVRGVNPDGSKYTGTAEITVTSKNTCRIVWDVGSESSGICMRNGIALAAGYVLKDKIGLIIYEIREDGALDGIWTIADESGAGSELLIPK